MSLLLRGEAKAGVVAVLVSSQRGKEKPWRACFFFFVTGGRRGVKKLGEGAAATSLGFGRAPSFFF
jgi:hypothetical protein